MKNIIHSSMMILCAVALILALWLMIGPDYQARADIYGEAGAQLSEAGQRNEAERYIAQALAINPYRASLWAQLGYVAPQYRAQAAQLSESLTKGALFERLEAAGKIEGTDDEDE